MQQLIGRRAATREPGRVTTTSGGSRVKLPGRLAGLVLANVAASALHFGDNMLRFHAYPEPAWITSPGVVDALWFAMTPICSFCS